MRLTKYTVNEVDSSVSLSAGGWESAPRGNPTPKSQARADMALTGFD
jgi:hypothetical protein